MFWYQLVIFLTIIQLTFSQVKLSCYQCKSTSKQMLSECEDQIPKIKNLVKTQITNCTTNKKGIKPRCFKAIGKNKENEKIVIRDCGYFTGESRCNDFNLDTYKLKNFNGCLTLCDKDYCNSANERMNFLLILFIFFLIVFSFTIK